MAKNRNEKSKDQPKQLTEVELELMTILWRLGEGSVNDVMAALPEDRDLAYTSISTILRILEHKEIVTTRKEGRGHIYIPMIEKAEYEANSVSHLIDKVFDGAPLAMMNTLVARLVDTGGMGKKDLESLKALIAKAQEGKS